MNELKFKTTEEVSNAIIKAMESQPGTCINLERAELGRALNLEKPVFYGENAEVTEKAYNECGDYREQMNIALGAECASISRIEIHDGEVFAYPATFGEIYWYDQPLEFQVKVYEQVAKELGFSL